MEFNEFSLQSSQTAFLDNHAEAIEFGNDFILDDGEGADDLGDMNGIDALFDTWNDGELNLANFNVQSNNFTLKLKVQ